MRWALLPVAILVLVGCTMPGSRAPTPTPYAGARTNGDPTPGKIAIRSNQRGMLSLVVAGDLATVVEQYAAAWRADGWEEASRVQSSDNALVFLERGDAERILAFAPHGTTAHPETFVLIRLP